MKTQKQAKPISDELIDTLLTHGQTAEDINGLLKQLTKSLLERAMQCELTAHLGYGKHDPSGNNSGNSRNGVTRKTLSGDFGESVNRGTSVARLSRTIPSPSLRPLSRTSAIQAPPMSRFSGWTATI
jgi:hypothetical protein